MTSYATETTPVQPAPMVFTDVLPGTKPAAIRWTPGRKVGTGLLCIQSKAGRCSCEYLVAELPAGDGHGGRAVLMAKTVGTPGSDTECDHYTVTVSRDGRSFCECRGFLRHSHCKHASAAIALLGNGWLDLHGANPDADTGRTEPIEDQPEPKPTHPFRPAWMERAEATF